MCFWETTWKSQISMQTNFKSPWGLVGVFGFCFASGWPCWFRCGQTVALSGVKLHGNQSCVLDYYISFKKISKLQCFHLRLHMRKVILLDVKKKKKLNLASLRSSLPFLILIGQSRYPVVSSPVYQSLRPTEVFQI